MGTIGRYWIGNVLLEKWVSPFPWSTLLVNVTGSFLIGLIANARSSDGNFLLSLSWREFAMIGVLGGYTTFSAFSFQTLRLLQQNQWVNAVGYICLSVLLCLAAVWLGDLVARSL